MQTSKDPGFGRGLLFAFAAYGIWGLFPFVVAALAFASPSEIVTWRIVFGFIFAALLTTITRSWKKIAEVLTNWKLLKWQLLATVFIMINWEVYVYAVATRQTLEASLGYFINPLVTILLAVVFLREKLSRLQWVATGFGAVAGLILTLDYGRLPWIAISLALSFGTYSLAKNKLGGKVSAINSFSLESGILIPLAIVQLLLVAGAGIPIEFGSHGIWPSLGLAGFGVLTAIPLMLFGAAARRLPLRYIGFVQYLTPIMAFTTAILAFHEPMPAARWAGFALVWVGLIVLIADAVIAGRKARALAK